MCRECGGKFEQRGIVDRDTRTRQFFSPGSRIVEESGELISSGRGKVVTKAGWKIIESREDSFWSRNENS